MAGGWPLPIGYPAACGPSAGPDCPCPNMLAATAHRSSNPPPPRETVAGKAKQSQERREALTSWTHPEKQVQMKGGRGYDQYRAASSAGGH